MAMSKPQPRRFTGNSKAGRQIMSANSPIRANGFGLTQEQRDWNAQVEAKKAAKKAAKNASN